MPSPSVTGKYRFKIYIYLMQNGFEMFFRIILSKPISESVLLMYHLLLFRYMKMKPGTVLLVEKWKYDKGS